MVTNPCVSKFCNLRIEKITYISVVIRKNSSVASNSGSTTIPEQGSTTATNSMHPLVKGKSGNTKVSVSSSNLEESLNGIVGKNI